MCKYQESSGGGTIFTSRWKTNVTNSSNEYPVMSKCVRFCSIFLSSYQWGRFKSPPYAAPAATSIIGAVPEPTPSATSPVSSPAPQLPLARLSLYQFFAPGGVLSQRHP